MKYAAFFRNLNLGRPNCPTRVQFEQAFIAAGASSASSFLTNGTMVFSAGSAGRPRKLLADASELLRGTCGLREPAFIRPVETLADLVAENPFAAVEPGTVYERCVSFLSTESETLAKLPLASKRGDVKLLQCTGADVLSVSLKIGKTPGSPNAFLEKLLGLPATTRSWSTVVRLVQRFS